MAGVTIYLSEREIELLGDLLWNDAHITEGDKNADDKEKLILKIAHTIKKKREE